VKALANRTLSCTHWRVSAPRVTQTQSAERFPDSGGKSGCCVQCLAMNPLPSSSSSGEQPLGSQAQVRLDLVEIV
jgi:hypothetical protein